MHDLYAESLDRLDIDVHEREIETRHGTTHVLVTGSPGGQPVMLFHGGNATNPMTLSWYAGLAGEYRLIAPDTIGQPGHSEEVRVDPNGSGYGEWVVDLLDAFDLASAPMVGTSYGAGIILRTATLAPGRIDRAALVVPAGFGTGSLASVARIGVESLLYRYVGLEWFLDRVLSAIVTQPDPDDVVRRTIAASLRYVDLEREFPSATEADLRDFTARTMLFAGERDPFFPPADIIPRARSRVPNLSKATVLDGERHIISPRGQQQVTACIGDFLADGDR